MAVADPELDRDLNATAGEQFIDTMAHRHILSVKNDHRLLSLHQRLAGLIILINLSEEVFNGNTISSLFSIFAFVLNFGWLSNRITQLRDI